MGNCGCVDCQIADYEGREGVTLLSQATRQAEELAECPDCGRVGRLMAVKKTCPACTPVKLSSTSNFQASVGLDTDPLHESAQQPWRRRWFARLSKVWSW